MAELTSKAAADPGGEASRAEQLRFKKRARRRLVGAIALALLAVIVLPMVMDQEPKPLTQDIQIRIPNRESSVVSSLARSVTGKPLPTPLPAIPSSSPASPAAAAVAAATSVTKPETQTGSRPAPKSTVPQADAVDRAASPGKPIEGKAVSSEQPAVPPLERKSGGAPGAAQLDGEQWVVQLGAYRDPANVKSLQNRLKGIGLPSFTENVETPQGPRTRVRGGPFASHAAAEKAQAQLKKLAIGAPAGGVVAQKP